MKTTMIKDYEKGYNEGITKGHNRGYWDGRKKGKEKEDFSPRKFESKYFLGYYAGLLVEYDKGYNEGVTERILMEKEHKERRKENGWIELKDLKIDINDYKFMVDGEYENQVTNRFNKIKIGKFTIKELQAKIETKIEASQKLYNKKNLDQCMYIDNVEIGLYSIDKVYLGDAYWSDDDGLTGIEIHEERMKEEMKK